MKDNRQRINFSNMAEKFNLWTPPLRPSREDIEAMENAVTSSRDSFTGHTCKAILWGVTPEIANMSWPNGTEILAIDESEEMIKFVWPGDIEGFRKTYCGQWIDTASIAKDLASVIIGDGCFNALDYPDGFQKLAVTAYKALQNNGILIMRFFLRPETHEERDAIFQELMTNKIGNFHVFRFRLAMSLQKDVQRGARMQDLWHEWKDSGIDMEELITLTGWPKEIINTIGHYKDSNARIVFPIIEELEPIFSDLFRTTAITFPKYEMGKLCPTLVFEKR